MALVPLATSLLQLESHDDPSRLLSLHSMESLLDTQRHLFHSQLDQLHRLVAAQCQLTGVNPLAQEMAAGALSIQIGKKPRDLLNPKAIKYLQSIFSIKDNIGKKELREISANSAITVTQAKDFFTSQRSRVRKIVRLSREKAIRLEPSVLGSSDQESNAGAASGIFNTSHYQTPQSITPSTIPVDTVEPTGPVADVVPLAVLPPAMSGPTGEVCMNSDASSTNLELPPAKLKEDDGMKEEDKKFVDDVLGLMRKETTFSGQVRLMESLLHINNDAVLNWFIVKEGLTILIAWLGEAAAEEQTSIILTIFKVLCHLPLSKATPAQISSILQAINRFRFYRTSDISNRAKVLLSKWSKLLRSQLLKKSPNDTQKDLIRKQRISELLRAQSGDSEVGFPENILSLTENGDEKKPEPKMLRLRAAPFNGSSKRNGASLSSLKNREKRKVLLVEHTDRKAPQTATRIARTAIISNSRPLSADDIQKAKLRASYMQQKHGKVDVLKTENEPKMLAKPDIRKFTQPTVQKSVNKPDIDPLDMKERLKHAQVLWRTPPEVRIDPAWQVCTGDSSKERGFQAQRIRREPETFYPDPVKIPPDPKDPWDVEMDFDDSLTPEIPIDQPPDVEPGQMQEDLVQLPDQPSVASTSLSSETIVATSTDTSALPEPDMELLAVLLKNPQVVFALTSGQASGLSSEQTVALLDMLKNSGVALSDLANGSVGGNTATGSGLGPEPVSTSLPSPTPTSERVLLNFQNEYLLDWIKLSFIISAKFLFSFFSQVTWRSEFSTNPSKPVIQAHAPIQNSILAPVASPVVAASSTYNNAVSGFNSQSLSVNLASPQFMTINSVPTGTQIHHPAMNAASVNPILSQNISSISSQNVGNHQIMTSLETEQSAYVGSADAWARQAGNLPQVSDPSARFSPYGNRYNTVGGGSLLASHVMPGPTWDGDHNLGRHATDNWGLQSGPGRRGDSSACWGYNEQRRDGAGYSGQRWHGRDHDRRR
ncbi:Homeobox protein LUMINIDEPENDENS [Rhynchospora pubera]|uniref:Homeobox protein LUMINIDEPENDENS n=1 Tax=Rhynchospora pubera TaxID=906938 RepID=A0AAV8ECP2_9POAL|nr:Homeobox protein LUMINIDEPENDENS [Rhynchospora pubera]